MESWPSNRNTGSVTDTKRDDDNSSKFVNPGDQHDNPEWSDKITKLNEAGMDHCSAFQNVQSSDGRDLYRGQSDRQESGSSSIFRSISDVTSDSTESGVRHDSVENDGDVFLPIQEVSVETRILEQKKREIGAVRSSGGVQFTSASSSWKRVAEYVNALPSIPEPGKEPSTRASISRNSSSTNQAKRQRIWSEGHYERRRKFMEGTHQSFAEGVDSHRKLTATSSTGSNLSQLSSQWSEPSNPEFESTDDVNSTLLPPMSPLREAKTPTNLTCQDTDKEMCRTPTRVQFPARPKPLTKRATFHNGVTFNLEESPAKELSSPREGSDSKDEVSSPTRQRPKPFKRQMTNSELIALASKHREQHSSIHQRRQTLVRMGSSNVSDESDTDVSAQSVQSVSSIDELLNSRQDPEELLTNLGFGGSPQDDMLDRIPTRFLQKPSDAQGISVYSFLNQMDEFERGCGFSLVGGLRGLESALRRSSQLSPFGNRSLTPSPQPSEVKRHQDDTPKNLAKSSRNSEKTAEKPRSIVFPEAVVVNHTRKGSEIEEDKVKGQSSTKNKFNASIKGHVDQQVLHGNVVNVQTAENDGYKVTCKSDNIKVKCVSSDSTKGQGSFVNTHRTKPVLLPISLPLDTKSEQIDKRLGGVNITNLSDGANNESLSSEHKTNLTERNSNLTAKKTNMIEATGNLTDQKSTLTSEQNKYSEADDAKMMEPEQIVLNNKRTEGDVHISMGGKNDALISGQRSETVNQVQQRAKKSFDGSTGEQNTNKCLSNDQNSENNTAHCKISLDGSSLREQTKNMSLPSKQNSDKSSSIERNRDTGSKVERNMGKGSSTKPNMEKSSFIDEKGDGDSLSEQKSGKGSTAKRIRDKGSPNRTKPLHVDVNCSGRVISRLLETRDDSFEFEELSSEERPEEANAAPLPDTSHRHGRRGSTQSDSSGFSDEGIGSAEFASPNQPTILDSKNSTGAKLMQTNFDVEEIDVFEQGINDNSRDKNCSGNKHSNSQKSDFEGKREISDDSFSSKKTCENVAKQKDSELLSENNTEIVKPVCESSKNFKLSDYSDNNLKTVDLSVMVTNTDLSSLPSNAPKTESPIHVDNSHHRGSITTRSYTFPEDHDCELIQQLPKASSLKDSHEQSFNRTVHSVKETNAILKNEKDKSSSNLIAPSAGRRKRLLKMRSVDPDFYGYKRYEPEHRDEGQQETSGSESKNRPQSAPVADHNPFNFDRNLEILSSACAILEEEIVSVSDRSENSQPREMVTGDVVDQKSENLNNSHEVLEEEITPVSVQGEESQPRNITAEDAKSTYPSQDLCGRESEPTAETRTSTDKTELAIRETSLISDMTELAVTRAEGLKVAAAEETTLADGGGTPTAAEISSTSDEAQKSEPDRLELERSKSRIELINQEDHIRAREELKMLLDCENDDPLLSHTVCDESIEDLKLLQRALCRYHQDLDQLEIWSYRLYQELGLAFTIEERENLTSLSRVRQQIKSEILSLERSLMEKYQSVVTSTSDENLAAENIWSTTLSQVMCDMVGLIKEQKSLRSFLDDLDSLDRRTSSTSTPMSSKKMAHFVNSAKGEGSNNLVSCRNNEHNHNSNKITSSFSDANEHISEFVDPVEKCSEPLAKFSDPYDPDNLTSTEVTSDSRTIEESGTNRARQECIDPMNNTSDDHMFVDPNSSQFDDPLKKDNDLNSARTETCKNLRADAKISDAGDASSMCTATQNSEISVWGSEIIDPMKEVSDLSDLTFPQVMARDELVDELGKVQHDLELMRVKARHDVAQAIREVRDSILSDARKEFQLEAKLLQVQMKAKDVEIKQLRRLVDQLTQSSQSPASLEPSASGK